MTGYPPPGDPTYLGALETGWEQGYDEALHAVSRILNDPGIDVASIIVHDRGNPYTRLRDDRRAYVRKRVTEAFGSFYGPDDEDVFEEADFIDAILDAHTDWLTPQIANYLASNHTPEKGA